jgi:hypothetical protein
MHFVAVCLPGPSQLDLSAVPVSISAGSLRTYVLLDFKVAKWAVSSSVFGKKFPTAEL